MGRAQVSAERPVQFAEQRLRALNGYRQPRDLDGLEPELFLEQAIARALLLGRPAEARGQPLRTSGILSQAGQNVLRVGEVFPERRLRLGRPHGRFSRLSPLLLELRLQNLLAMRQALPLPLQAADDLPELFRLAGRLCHTNLEFPNLPQTRIQHNLPLGRLLSKPLELPVAPLHLGAQPVPFGREACDLGFARAEVFPERRLRLGRPHGRFSRLSPLLLELRLQNLLAMRQALPLPLQAADDLPELFRLAGRLCHTNLEFPNLPQTRIQHNLPLGRLLSKPLELPVAPLHLGAQPVPFGREACDLGFARAEVFPERRLRLGRPHGRFSRLSPLLLELRLQNLLAMRQALPLPLQAADDLPELFRLAGRLCHTNLEFPNLPQTRIQHNLPLGRLLSKPLELPVAPLHLGAQPVPFGREACDLGFARAEVFPERRLRLGRPHGRFSRLSPLLLELRLQNLLAMRQALPLPLQAADDLPELFRLAGRLCHTNLEFPNLPQTRIQHNLPLGRLLSKPLELPVAPLHLGAQPVPFGRERTNLRFKLGASLQDRAPLALQDSQAVALLLDLPPPALEPIGQGIEDGGQALRVANGVHQDLVVPKPLAQDGLLILVVWLQLRLRHRRISAVPAKNVSESRQFRQPRGRLFDPCSRKSGPHESRMKPKRSLNSNGNRADCSNRLPFLKLTQPGRTKVNFA